MTVNICPDKDAACCESPMAVRCVGCPTLAQQVPTLHLDGVNTERLSQALTWMGVAGPVSLESYINGTAKYVNNLTDAVMRHKQATETSAKAQSNEAMTDWEIDHVLFALPADRVSVKAHRVFARAIETFHKVGQRKETP